MCVDESIQMLTDGLAGSPPAGLAASLLKALPGRWISAALYDSGNINPGRCNGSESQ